MYLSFFSPLIFLDSLSTAVLSPAKDKLHPALLIIGSGSLKKLLLEYQLPPWLRDRIPLLYVKDQLVAVGNLWVCEGWGVEPEETGIEIYWQVDSL